VAFYFAYGSNMAQSTMARSVPDAVDAGPARLDGYRLRFSRHSRRWNAGAADVVPAPELCTWGRLYELPEACDLAELDKREGVLAGAYRREAVEVVTLEERQLTAMTYVVVDKLEVEEAPSETYLQLMLEGGAEGTPLPERYCDFLDHLAQQASSCEQRGVFRDPLVLMPTRLRTGRGSGPLLLTSELSRWQCLFRPYAAVRVGSRRSLVRVDVDRELPSGHIRVDQVVRASLTNRNIEAFGYDAAVEYVRRPVPRLPPLIRARTTVLTVTRPAVADSEKNVAIIHEKPLQLLGIGAGSFVKVRAASATAARVKVSSCSIRAYGGSDADLSHVNRPVYPTEHEISLDAEGRAALGVSPGDAVWVSASIWPLLRERLFFYAITVLLGMGALVPLFEQVGVTGWQGFLWSATLPLLTALLVALAELRQRIGA
jgi:cation transport regulator ChaC